jgi:hypothetical protein
MSYVNHRSTKELARRFLRSKGTRIGGVDMMLAEKYIRGGIFL